MAALALLGAATAGGLSPSRAAGQGIEPQPTVRIVSQTTFVPADGAIELLVEVDGVDGLAIRPGAVGAEADAGNDVGPELSVTFFGRLETENQVDLPPSQPLNRLPGITLDRAPRTPEGQVRLMIPIRSGSSFDDQDRVLLPEPGVYPLTVELRDADGPLASARTHLVRQPIETADEPAQAPVEVGVVLHVTSAEGLSVEQAAALLTQHPTVPLTVVLDTGLVNRLRAEPETAATLAAALGGRPVLTAPTIDLDPSALAEIGHGDLYLTAAEADRRALADLGLQPAVGQALLSAPLTDAGLAVLRREGVDAVLDLGDRFLGTGVIDGQGRAIEVIRTDADLNRILRGDDPPAMVETGPHRANRVLARLSLRREVDDQPVVIGGPALGVDPAPALTAFLAALSQPGAPRPIPLSAVRGGPNLRTAERPQQDLSPVAGLVDGLRDRLVTYESFHLGGGTDPDDYRQRLVGALTRQRNPDDRLQALTLIANQLRADLGTIHIHQPQPVTLAARSASIPLVVDNTSAGPRHVLLEFRGDRVVSPDDGRLLLVQPGTSSIDIEVEARSLGVSPLEVVAWTPDGSVELTRARFEIRSTAVPGLGLLVSIGALGLLGLWWIVDHRRRRRELLDVTDGEVDRAAADSTPSTDHRDGRPSGARTGESGETLEPQATSV